MIEILAAAGGAFAPVDQGNLLEARQMQALSLAALNSRPRKTLAYKTPAEALNEHLLSLETATA